MRTLLFAIFTSFSVPVYAQSSLGITGASFSLGATQDEAGDLRWGGLGAVDVAVTEHHGFQGDVALTDTASGVVGTLAAHLYMTPKEGQKYGLFAALSDVDGRAMMYGSVGAEGMLSLGLDTSAEARAGVGWADVDGLDYIFAGVSVAHELSPAFEIEASFDAAEFDEAAFSATSYDLGLRAHYSPEGAPWGAYASVTHSGLTGTDGAAGETRLGLGLTWTLGATGGADPHSRTFRSVDPVAPLLRRGLW